LIVCAEIGRPRERLLSEALIVIGAHFNPKLWPKPEAGPPESRRPGFRAGGH
jgi:hypothetical protein